MNTEDIKAGTIFCYAGADFEIMTGVVHDNKIDCQPLLDTRINLYKFPMELLLSDECIDEKPF